MKVKILLLLLFLFAFAKTTLALEETIILATTTSVENSGLLSYLLPIFEEKTGIKVRVVARGTGAAIEMGKRGDADLLLVHAKELEIEAVEQGYFVDRHEIFYNDFVIVGPTSDPAQVGSAKSAIDAIRRIASTQSLFVSRADESGTHLKEMQLWERMGINPKRQKWYLEAGQSMEKTLRIANEKGAYTLTDRATWLTIKEELELSLLFQGDSLLFNQYSVMAVSPKRHKHVKYDEAMAFINWIISEEGQRAVASFKDERGNQLFIPSAK